MISVAIIEDDAELREAIVTTLQAEPDFTVAAESATAERALQSFPWNQLQVLLLDLNLPGMSGIELTAVVKALHPDVAILVNTILEDKEAVFAALRNGAAGYILKGDQAGELAASLRHVLAGGGPMSPAIARWIIEEFQTNCALGVTPEAVLSEREVEILRHLERGRIYKEIADDLNISAHTVHAHLRKIYAQLSVRGRANALKKAKLLGYL
jgi:DNA-binding NarL/FixJ family response regulator